MGKVCYKYIVHMLKSSICKTILFANDLCRAMLPTSWGHISVLCAKIESARRHLRSQTMSKVYLKSLFWMHAFDWPKQIVNIYIQYSKYFSCNNIWYHLCRAFKRSILFNIWTISCLSCYGIGCIMFREPTICGKIGAHFSAVQ